MYDLRNFTITSSHPCLLVYLIDQSRSMDLEFGNSSQSRAEVVANAINDLIYDVGLRCIGGMGELKNRFEIAIVGYGKYGHSVHSAWEGQLAGRWVVPIKEIFEYPLSIIDEQPVWILPYTGYNTPMTRAFENAKRLCSDWIKWGNHSDCHPPIVVNISDGEATDAGENFIGLKKEIQEIKELKTNYGHVKVLNIHISGHSGSQLLFPERVNYRDKFQEMLFESSSVLDENMIRIARQRGYEIGNQAKGYVFNGNVLDLVNFLNIGTPQ